MQSGADAVLAAAEWARAHGADRVVVVGASMGGTVSVLAASQDSDHQLDAMADLSGPIIYLDANTTGAGSDISTASFFAVAPSDNVVSVFQIQNLASGISSPTPILHLDAVGHGWSLLSDSVTADPYFNTLADQLASFIEGPSPTS
jgi:dienelactone hydrolase